MAGLSGMTLTDARLAHGILPVLIWTAGPDGACDYLNDRWIEFTGRPVADMLGWKWVESVHPEDRERLVAEYTAQVTARGPLRLEFRMLHQHGEYRWLLALGEPCHGPAGEFLGYSGCSTDVTDRRALGQRLVELDRAGEIAQLASGIAHDFNNLLTGILGHVGLLLGESSLSPEGREDLAQITQAADRAATLARHLLTFSRRTHPAPRAADLNQLVSGTMSAIRQIVGPLVEVRRELADGLEPALVNPSHLERVLLQLAARAQAAMPQGGLLRLRTGRVRVDEALAARHGGLHPGSYLTLEIEYQGETLDTTALARVFEVPRDPQAGDLSSFPAMARQSGGHIAVESSPGHGTMFTVFIPRLGAPQGADAVGGVEHDGDETILLVEDDEQVREVVRRGLACAGYTVLAVSDAEAAIAAADRHPGHIHLLVTDVVLPRASGRELAARLGIHRPAIKVLYVSGTSDGAIARHRMLEPGIAFLEKPFSLDRFLTKVRQVLGSKPSAEDQAAWVQRSLV
jgi:two-component system cell cycle sensor histidine kinase/response regulator CckA